MLNIIFHDNISDIIFYGLFYIREEKGRERERERKEGDGKEYKEITLPIKIMKLRS
jgi:hypothetical protein